MKQPTWHESLPPARTPAQIMLSVTLPTPFRQLHCLFPRTGSSTSCRRWGNGKDTDGMKDEEKFTHKPTNYRTHGHWNKASRLASLSDCSPARHPAFSAAVEHAATRSQTHRSDVVGESDWRRESEQSNVVVAGHTVIVWVQNDCGNISGHLVWVWALQALTAERNLPSEWIYAAVYKKKIHMLYDKTALQTFGGLSYWYSTLCWTQAETVKSMSHILTFVFHEMAQECQLQNSHLIFAFLDKY